MNHNRLEWREASAQDGFSVIEPARFLVYSHVNTVATPYRCPCCGYKTLNAPGAMGLCPVCWWEDDGQEDSDAAEIRLTVNGHLSLNEARDHYEHCGAAHPRFLRYVRKPSVTEQ